MTSTSGIVFQGTPATLGLSLLAVIATSALCLTAWRRSGFARSVGWLELLRLAAVLATAALFNQPEWIEEHRPDEKPTLAILLDESRSMSTQDVVSKDAPGKPRSRREAIEPLSEAGFWDDLSERFNVVISTFPGEEEKNATDLHAPIAAVADDQSRLRGVVLISDGDWNAGRPPVDAATRLRLRDTPVFTIPVGSPTPLPDVELVSLDAPTFGIAGKRVRIPVTIDSSLPQDYTTAVQLRVSSGEVITQQVRVRAMSRTTASLSWEAVATGDYTLTATLPAHAGEQITDNNELSAPIAIRDERLRVLVVESYPRWEYRYLRNALSRDPGVEVSCLLFHPGLSKQGGGNKDYIKEFPEGLDQLTQYDVIFLGDVGCSENQLTAEQCRLIKGLVEHQASGLVVMPGWQGRQVSLLETELADLYPVVLDPAQPGGWGSRGAEHFQLTEVGGRSLLTKLADTTDENTEVWERLPGFQWYAPVVRAAAGSEVLAVHESASNQYGRLPLLVTRPFGAGKVLFMGTDGAWRWRKGVEDKYHYRFWGQVVRWMAYQRNMARGESMRLYYTPDQPQIRQTLTLNANVMDSSGEPLSGGEVTARIVSPSGRGETVRFRSVGEEWGAFSGRYTPQEPGKHEVTLFAKSTGDTLSATFYAQGSEAEKIGQPARVEVLEEIARVSRGKTVSIDNAQDAVRQLAALPDPPPTIRRLQLWSDPAIATSLVGLLGVFWILRKAAGLI